MVLSSICFAQAMVQESSCVPAFHHVPIASQEPFNLHEVLWNSHTMKMLQARPERSNQQLLFQRSRYHRIDPPTIQHEIDPWPSQHEYNNCWNSRSAILFPVIDATERKIGPITLMSHGSVNLPKPDFARHSSKRDPHSEWFYFTTQLSDAGFIAPGISATPGQHNAGAMKSSPNHRKGFPSLSWNRFDFVQLHHAEGGRTGPRI